MSEIDSIAAQALAEANRVFPFAASDLVAADDPFAPEWKNADRRHQTDLRNEYAVEVANRLRVEAEQSDHLARAAERERQEGVASGLLVPTPTAAQRRDMKYAVIADGDLWKPHPIVGWDHDEPLVSDGRFAVEASNLYPSMRPGYIGCSATAVLPECSA